MKERVFVNTGAKAVMCYSRTLGCWCCYFVKKDGSPNKRKKAVYGFDSTRRRAITLIRKEVSIPQEGWDKLWMNTKNMNMEDVCKVAWGIIINKK